MGVNGIYGLSGSGLDIESMVKVGMMSKQNEYDKMAQKYTKNEWTKNALIDLNNQITTFNLSSLTDYKLQSNMNAKTATSSNEAAVKATSSANAPIMSHKVSVKNLSYNAYLIGDNTISNVIAQLKLNEAADSEEVKELAKTDAIKNLASEGNLKNILFKNLSYRTDLTVTSNYNGATINGNTTTYTPATNVKTGLSVTRNGSGNVTSVSYKGAGSDSSQTYNDVTSTNVSTTSTTTSTTTYTGIGAGNTLTLTLTATTETNNGTASPTTYKINVNGTEKEYTLDSSTSNGFSGTTNTYKSTDGSSTVAITTGALLSASNTISINGGTGFGYSSRTSTTTSSTKTETISTNGGPTVTLTEETLNGKVTSRTAKTVKTGESGITGATFGDLALSAGYSSGKGTLVQKTDTAIAFTIGDGTKTTDTISFTYGDLIDGIDGKDVTMNDLVSKIKTAISDAGVNVKVEYDNFNERFSIYNPNGDSESAVIIKPVGSNTSEEGASTRTNQVTTGFLNALNLKLFDGESLKATETPFEAWGSVGTINVDGIDYETKDNKVTVGGVTYTAFSSTTNPTTGANTPATVTVGQDVDAIVDRVKSFVESYNKILGSLYEKYDEKADSNYKPLTQSQKDQMKDEQIEKWEEKAKQGLLYHDQTLSKIINQMRNAISLEVEGIDSKYKSAYSIGIETTGLKGQLKFNEDKLRNALAEDGDAVSKIFTKLDTEAKPNASGIVKENGIAQRLGDILTNATKLIKNRAGSSTDIVEDSELNNLLRELQTKMSNFKKMMNAFEDRLYKKYDAMEVALSKLGTQLNFITGGQ